MKFLGEDTIRNIGEKMGAKGGDLVLMIADKPATMARALGELRLEVARRMNMIDPDKLAFHMGNRFPLCSNITKMKNVMLQCTIRSQCLVMKTLIN